jgi:hypothetical protein
MTGAPTSAMLGLSTGAPLLHSGNPSVRQVHCIVLRPVRTMPDLGRFRGRETFGMAQPCFNGRSAFTA